MITARMLSVRICLFVGVVATIGRAAEFYSGDSLIDPRELAILGVSSLTNDVAQGAILVGQARDESTSNVAYRWSERDGIQFLGQLPADTILGNLAGVVTSWTHQESNARAIAANGTTIVGTSSLEFDLPQGHDWASQAFRWSEDLGMVPLGVLPAHDYSEALDVSHDGSVIVGFSERVDVNFTEATPPHELIPVATTPFRWTQTAGLEPLSLPQGFDRGLATQVSFDGQVIAGVLQNSGGSYPFRWTEPTGTELLTESWAGSVLDTSADGSVIVGQVWDPSDGALTHAFRWTDRGGLQILTDLRIGAGSSANAVTADGSLILGSYLSSTGFRAYLWDDGGSMRDLQEVLSLDFGLMDTLAGWTLFAVRGISRDGKIVHGIGETPDGSFDDWIVFLDRPLNGVTSAGDFDGDGMVNAVDINLLAAAIRGGSLDARFDLDGTGGIDASDLDDLIHDILHTYFGDANLDFEFNSLDIISVFQAGVYEDELPLNADWATGDWDGDGDFTSSDLITALADGGYEAGRPAARSVPEPAAYLLTLVALLLLVNGRGKCH